MELIKPNNKSIKSYIKEFNNENIKCDLAIHNIFKMYHRNNDYDEVRTKVSVLNSLYGTVMYATSKVSRHIVNCKIDRLLSKIQ